MRVIFCASPLSIRQPDELYQHEVDAVQNLGLETSLLDFEALTQEANVQRVVRMISPGETQPELAIYRGWMLTPAQYELLYEALLAKGLKLINDPVQYRHCHFLPGWFDLLKEHTSKSVWFPIEELGDSLSGPILKKLLAGLSIFEGSPAIVKDYVKSEKHRWHEACFIPDSRDSSVVFRVSSKFLELRGHNLQGGLVFRQFEEFKPLTTHSQSGMPLIEEYRLFVMDGQIVHWIPYWEEGEYNGQPPLAEFAEIARIPRSRFFSMDIAQTKDGRWLVVELGDGQVTGLPDNAIASEFYKAILPT